MVRKLLWISRPILTPMNFNEQTLDWLYPYLNKKSAGYEIVAKSDVAVTLIN